MSQHKAPVLSGESDQFMDAFMAYFDCDGDIAEVARRLNMDTQTLQSWEVAGDWKGKMERLFGRERWDFEETLSCRRARRMENALLTGTTLDERFLERLRGMTEFKSDMDAIVAARVGHALISYAEKWAETGLDTKGEESPQLKAILDMIDDHMAAHSTWGDDAQGEGTL